ncbi:uncharacterized protein [Manis javanica]|uniref:uncharacterized protein n=1 Tax=Manis javanica TaxID=9974 RepID=UPI003C6D3E7F
MLRPWQPTLSAAPRQRRQRSSACKFVPASGQEKGRGRLPREERAKSLPTAHPGCPATATWRQRRPGAGHPPPGAQCRRTYPPRASRRSLWEPPSPELPVLKKDGGVRRETTHSSVWQPQHRRRRRRRRGRKEQRSRTPSAVHLCAAIGCLVRPREPRGAGRRPPPCASPPAAAAPSVRAPLPPPRHLFLPTSPAGAPPDPRLSLHPRAGV